MENYEAEFKPAIMMSPYTNCIRNPPIISNRYGIPGVIQVFGFSENSALSAL
jgi:hypothetical protein